MFEKIISKNPSESTPSPQSSPPRQASSGSSSPSSSSSSSPNSLRNILSSDVIIKGNVRFKSELVVDGKIEGEIESKGALTVGENAQLNAEIKTNSVLIYGKVHGNIFASGAVELRKSAEVIGDIRAATLTMEAGAVFVGKSTIGAPSSNPSSQNHQNQPRKEGTQPHQKPVASPQQAAPATAPQGKPA